MEEHNGPGAHAGGHPLGDSGRVIVLPVQTVHIPLDGLNAHPPDGGDDVVVILPERRAEERGALAGDLLDLIVAGVDVLHNLICGEGIEVGVVVGVPHHLVAGICQGLDGLGVLIHPLPHHKEGDFHVVLVKDVDEGLGVFVAPSCVKREGAGLVVPLDAVDGELPLCGGGGDVGGQGGHQAQGADAQQRPGDGQPTLAQEDDLPLFSRFHAKEFHIDPVLSMSFYLYALFSKSCAPISHGMGTGRWENWAPSNSTKCRKSCSKKRK